MRKMGKTLEKHAFRIQKFPFIVWLFQRCIPFECVLCDFKREITEITEISLEAFELAWHIYLSQR